MKSSFTVISTERVARQSEHFFGVTLPTRKVRNDDFTEGGGAVISSESGFALVIVLIFIGILSECMLSILNSMELMKKTTTNFSIYDHKMKQIDFALQNAKQAILTGKIDDFNAVFSADGKTLRCKIELVQTLPCIKINDSDRSGTDFFKISVWSGDNLGAIHVESTFARVALSKSLCHQVSKTMVGGFLTWRIVNE